MTRRAGVPTLLSITSRGTHGTAHGGPRFRGEERKGGGRGYLSLQGSAGHDIRTDDCSTVACAPRTCACTCSRSTTNTSITESRLETLLQLIDTEKAALYHIPHVLSSSSSHSDILVIARVLIEGFCRCCNADAFTSTCPVCLPGFVAVLDRTSLGRILVLLCTCPSPYSEGWPSPSPPVLPKGT